MSEILIQTAGVFATALLVNSNKLILAELNIPSKSAALTLLHNASTFFWVRLSNRCTGLKVHEVYWGWLLLITGVGSLSVVASNTLLQLTSISVHQLIKLASLPFGAVLDYYLYGKRRSWVELAGLLLIIYGICMASMAELYISVYASCVAFIFISGYLATATLVRHVCTRYQITTSEFLHVSVPWGVFSSLIWFCVAYSIENRLQKDGPTPAGNGVMLLSIMALLNVFLAISVQWLSTWAARESTTMLYAVTGQAKTAATVIVSVAVFRESPSLRSICGLCLSLMVALKLAAKEAYEKEGSDSVKLCGRANSRTGNWLGSMLILAVLLLGTFANDQSIVTSMFVFAE